MTGSKVLHHGITAAAAKGDQVTSESDIFRSKRHTHAGGFQRRAASMIPRRIVAHDTHVADVTARGKAFRNYVGQAKHSARREPIHIRCPGGFERSLATKHFERIVRHAIALKN